jgi:hypothetical protein
VITHLKEIVTRIDGVNLDLDSLSFLLIATSNEVYLIFDKRSTAPILVLRKLSLDQNPKKTLEISTTLYRCLPNNVAHPLQIIDYEGSNYFVERGLDGWPWFQLRRLFDTNNKWLQLRDRLYASLETFKKGIRQSQNLRGESSLSCEFLACYKDARINSDELSSELKKRLSEFLMPLEELGFIDVFPQHGDFCLNNLVINKTDLYFIDFEDFGKTNFPYFDDISAALSFCIQTPCESNDAISIELSKVFGRDDLYKQFDSNVYRSLFVYNLLFRLGIWSYSPDRKKFRDWIESLLKSFLDGDIKI